MDVCTDLPISYSFEVRGLAAFLIFFGAAIFFFTLGETVGPHQLVYICMVTLGILAAAVLLRGTSNAIDWGTAFMVGRTKDDE
jgi:hypothetical protein